MAIIVDKNTLYGPPLVNRKYAPLAIPAFNNADQAIYTGLLNNRMRVLRALGLVGQQLELTMPNWANAVTAELLPGRQPPLVVVSSNRANWIRRAVDAAAAQLRSLNIAAYNGVSDLRALTDAAGLGISPPLYAPLRVGGNRGVYMVVNIAEYKFYKARLNGTGIVPVGWNFAKSATAQRDVSMLGFGATRFAAMEFCKSMRQRVQAAPGGVNRWNSAWMIDDNTVALTAFPGFAAVEGALGANACAGFHGGTSAEPASTHRVLAIRLINAAHPVPPLAPAPQGIVQQTALWNVAYFANQHLNFGPLFLASAEDLSIINYFNNAGIPYQYYNAITVYKEAPSCDNSAGGARVNRGRQELTRLVTAAESATPPAGTPPPPILVQPNDPADGGVQTLSDFVVNRVLPSAAAVAAQRGDANVQAQAKSQGVEQLTCGALNAGLVGAAAVTATFRINGNNQQAVQPRDLP